MTVNRNSFLSVFNCKMNVIFGIRMKNHKDYFFQSLKSEYLNQFCEKKTYNNLCRSMRFKALAVAQMPALNKHIM